MVDSSGTSSWTYDNADQVTQLVTPEGTMSYTYDDAGKKLTMVDAAGTTTYGYDDANRLTSLVTIQHPEGVPEIAEKQEPQAGSRRIMRAPWESPSAQKAC